MRSEAGYVEQECLLMLFLYMAVISPLQVSDLRTWIMPMTSTSQIYKASTQWWTASSPSNATWALLTSAIRGTGSRPVPHSTPVSCSNRAEQYSTELVVYVVCMWCVCGVYVMCMWCVCDVYVVCTVLVGYSTIQQWPLASSHSCAMFWLHWIVHGILDSGPC